MQEILNYNEALNSTKTENKHVYQSVSYYMELTQNEQVWVSWQANIVSLSINFMENQSTLRYVTRFSAVSQRRSSSGHRGESGNEANVHLYSHASCVMEMYTIKVEKVSLIFEPFCYKNP